jgi:5-(carboxyamino)imidazole ribonucleotide mutase
MDSLLSTVQMPAGIPVATVAIGKTGAKNAAYLAAQILALSDPGLAQRVKEEREQKARDVQAQDAALQEARRKN